MENVDDVVRWIQRQYFQVVAMKYFDWEKLRSRSESIEQERILKAVCSLTIYASS